MSLINITFTVQYLNDCCCLLYLLSPIFACSWPTNKCDALSRKKCDLMCDLFRMLNTYEASDKYSLTNALDICRKVSINLVSSSLAVTLTRASSSLQLSVFPLFLISLASPFISANERSTITAHVTPTCVIHAALTRYNSVLLLAYLS